MSSESNYDTKNIFAIAAGICDGLALGDNTKAALVTRSLAELIRLGTALGGKPETFHGLADRRSDGDVFFTTQPQPGRRRTTGPGRNIGQYYQFDANGGQKIPTTYSAYDCAKKLGIDTPIIDQIRLVLDGALSAPDALSALLQERSASRISLPNECSVSNPQAGKYTKPSGKTFRTR
jgi:glycerol-3-phosphate dehydrogenase (NAD(P)+)